VVKDFCELERGLVGSDEHTLSVLVRRLAGIVLGFLAYVASRRNHIGHVGNADVFLDPTLDRAEGDTSVDGLPVRNGHSSVDSSEKDGLAGSRAVDGIATGHLATTITPLMAVNTRGRGCTVVVATVDGLLPGMLRYMMLWN
jgi:hypothetical protein